MWPFYPHCRIWMAGNLFVDKTARKVYAGDEAHYKPPQDTGGKTPPQRDAGKVSHYFRRRAGNSWAPEEMRTDRGWRGFGCWRESGRGCNLRVSVGRLLEYTLRADGSLTIQREAATWGRAGYRILEYILRADGSIARLTPEWWWGGVWEGKEEGLEGCRENIGF